MNTNEIDFQEEEFRSVFRKLSEHDMKRLLTALRIAVKLKPIENIPVIGRRAYGLIFSGLLRCWR